MRIAVVTTSYPTYEGDPAGHFVEAEVRELERDEHEVKVIHPPAGGAFGWPGVAVRVKERPWRALEASGFVASAVMELRRFQPDRIVSHWVIPSGIPIVMTSGLSAELELVSHGGDVRMLCGMPRPLRDLTARRLAARAVQWRFVSDALREQLLASLSPSVADAVASRSVVRPSPLKMPDVRDAVRLRKTSLDGRRLYVTAGRLVASKRVDKVIDYVACHQFERDPATHRKPSERAPVLVVLGDGPERPYLEQLAFRWRLDARFLGTTPRGEALSWIAAADEVVHASRAEGLSTVVREAEHLGIPVKILT